MSGDLVRPARLGRVLASSTDDDAWLDLEARLVAGGKSNLTFELTSASGALILRRPPTGALLPSAHDMTREVRVQRALHGSAVPVPRIVHLEEGAELLGVPFYVMEKVEGHIVRDELPAGFASTVDEKQALADGLVDTLAALHAVDVATVGLADFGRPDGFLERQVRRWRDQSARSSSDRPSPELEALGAALVRRVPVSPPPALLHGDFRLDNCVLVPEAPGRVAAVLDWEMSTVGDPLTDLGMLLFFWFGPDDRTSSLVPSLTQAPGFPDREYLARRYAAATGIDPEVLGYYEAFANFKFAVIAQGIAARVAAGAMAGQEFGDVAGEVPGRAEDGLLALESWSGAQTPATAGG
ncbi:phosphotransferase family protein [Aeromicrobium sp. 50.2.37]|uniref:phosphotransferase family protein n=1 Tax=Aeromicrobium sp. 50.2.37 TaxID=2969305 RepID=UPI00214F70F8|nr:phosphotransferase family protein [Aeromicrobium sp. 50.2.37]MCR4514136.1 phosphotransferase family protein [Aeromicrobium sp. 50.2.37]